MKYASLTFIFAAAVALGAMKARADRKLEHRAVLFASSLHRTLGIDHDSFRAALVVYHQNRGALCLQYTDLNAANRMYVGRALLMDEAKELAYSLDAEDPRRTENCEAQYDRNLLDLAESVRNEDR
jgi:hypothetical protein